MYSDEMFRSVEENLVQSLLQRCPPQKCKSMVIGRPVFGPRINASSKHSIGSVDGLFLAAQDDNIVLDGCQSDGVLSWQKRRRAPHSKASYELGVVAKARVRSVFCSSSWALAEPVAGLALAERFTERTRRFAA